MSVNQLQAIRAILVLAVLTLNSFASAQLSDCAGDVNNDFEVNGADLGTLLSAWGGSEYDQNGDGMVNGADLGSLLSHWGTCPAPVEWTLVSHTNTSLTEAIDATGTVVRSWTGTGSASSIAYLRPDGSLVRPAAYASSVFGGGAARGGRIQIFNSAGAVQNDFVIASSTSQQHHDICPLPNGNILCIVWDLHTAAEAAAAGRSGLTGNIWSESIIEIAPTGTNTYSIVWQWRVWDHLIQESNAAAANYGVVADHPELIHLNYGTVTGGDWMHMNSIDFSATRNEIVFTSRSFSEIYVIDHSTTTQQAASHVGGVRGRGGDILYRWGNPQVSQRGTSASQSLFVVHGSSFISAGLPGADNLMAFNNGDRTGTANDWSQVVEIVPPRTTSGDYQVPTTGAFGPATPLWSVGAAGSFFGGAVQCGAFRTRANTTIITLTNSGTFFEVNAAGVTVATRNLGANVARAPRYRMVNGLWLGP